MKRVVNPDFASEYNWFLETANIVGASCYDPESGYTVDDLGVVALDDKTLQVTLTQPSGFFLSMLAFPTLFHQMKSLWKLKVTNMFISRQYDLLRTMGNVCLGSKLFI